MRSVSLAEQLVVVDVLVNKKYDCGHEIAKLFFVTFDGMGNDVYC
jgi:hypothetical protein